MSQENFTDKKITFSYKVPSGKGEKKKIDIVVPLEDPGNSSWRNGSDTGSVSLDCVRSHHSLGDDRTYNSKMVVAKIELAELQGLVDDIKVLTIPLFTIREGLPGIIVGRGFSSDAEEVSPISGFIFRQVYARGIIRTLNKS